MKSNDDSKFYEKYDKLPKKLKNIQEKRKLDDITIYKIYLYSIDGNGLKYCVKNTQINDYFKENRIIFVTKSSEDYVQEIITGENFPIVNIEQNQGWESSKLTCVETVIDQTTEFALSINGFLKNDSFSNIDDLNELSEYFLQGHKNYVKIK